jgi:SAM-dependent methyltransferase
MGDSRGRFQGVLQIVDYNVWFYAIASSCAVLALIATHWLPPLPAWLLGAGGGTTLLSIAVSLGVAHYVYDRSSLYDFRWMKKRLPDVNDWVNIHSGLDETTVFLQQLFPESGRHVIDIYDPQEMTEPSIARARAVSTAKYPALAADFRQLPLGNASKDAAFIIFAAHEIRDTRSRILFFAEVSRLLRQKGEVIVIEHLRDVPNLLAFGPGFFHFLSRGEWLRTFQGASLRLKDEFRITPFVRVFALERS